jgi:hypothetical protein
MLKTQLQNQQIKSDKADQNPNKKINPSKVKSKRKRQQSPNQNPNFKNKKNQ